MKTPAIIGACLLTAGLLAFGILQPSSTGAEPTSNAGLNPPTPAQPPTYQLTYEFRVQAAIDSWQFSGIELKPGDSAEISATGTWGVIDPPKRGLTGPGGNDVRATGGKWRYPGAKEGCLLMLLGDTKFAWPGDNYTQPINTPGRLSFLANDADGPDGGGWKDNVGSLLVKIVVKTQFKQHYPPSTVKIIIEP